MKFFTNAKTRMDICAAIAGPDQREDTQKIAQAYFEAGRRVKLRLITEMTKDNVAYCKELMKAVDLRHLDDSRGNFAISESEYLATPGTEEFSPMGPLLYSNERAFVKNHQAIFDLLWENAILAEERIAEIEQGIAPGRIEVISEPQKIQETLVDLIKQARDEILILLPTASAFRRQEKIGIVDSLQTAASEHGVRVSILSPNSLIQQTLQRFSEQNEAKYGRKLINNRIMSESTTPEPVMFFVFDRKASIIIEVKDDSQPDFADAVGVATYSTRNPTVQANVRFYERIWDEVELGERERVVLEKERRSQRAAELLQDVLSHDIRNYNQIVKTSAEMLTSDLPSPQRQSLVDAILKATNGSSDLVARAKKLGRILSQTEIALYPVDVERSLQTSVALIIKAYPDRSVHLSTSVKSDARVVADDLLEEVFTNILSNSVNYTERDEVPVEVEVEEERGKKILDQKPRPYWKISFTDHGKGISDRMKETIFTRYLSTATGAGLGLSIVHALVVERYSGKVAITDRVERDSSKGTKVEVWLPKAA
jgi:signal transduction histidine kinase